MEFDTIAAISTPVGEGGIAIIRISGEQTIPLVEPFFSGKDKLSVLLSHTLNYGFFVDQSNVIIDEVLLSIMRAPRSFTREDVVEINCHGGFLVANKILSILLKNGIRLAEPGEFAKRAFLNGRIDLTQAEAISDLIRAKTDRARAIALQQVTGKLSDKVNELRGKVIELLAFIEVNIDYPEHDIAEVTLDYINENLLFLQSELVLLLAQAQEGRIYRDGVATAIIGRPNVGKSSLLNVFLKEARAIVTDIPGTTRDIIEEYVNIRGIPLKLIDTAGIRKTDNIVEQIGVERSKQAIEQADLLLVVFANDEELTAEDLSLIELIHETPTIVVINKSDLSNKLDEGLLHERLGDATFISTSLTAETGIEELKEAIANRILTGALSSDENSYLSNPRHIDLLRNTLVSIEMALSAVKNKEPIDIIAIDLNEAYHFLSEVIGEAVADDLLNKIFANFCLGK